MVFPTLSYLAPSASEPEVEATVELVRDEVNHLAATEARMDTVLAQMAADVEAMVAMQQRYGGGPVFGRAS